MTAYVVLLRAVNVGGTGKLPMSDLKSLCEEAGFTKVRTYIASGNVVFTSGMTEGEVAGALDQKLKTYAGKPVGVVVRTAAEMKAVLEGNPFRKAQPNHTVAIFLDKPPPKDALDAMMALDGEEARLGEREIYIHYPNGQERSKLKLPAAKAGTARNINTVAKLAEMAGEL
jgi:uncharacterized protein (DUF1697 family)